jgi:hypothetical protein
MRHTARTDDDLSGPNIGTKRRRTRFSIRGSILPLTEDEFWVEDNPRSGSIFSLMLPVSNGCGTAQGMSEPF